jgi:iron(II)-dependent oxidoreductase
MVSVRAGHFQRGSSRQSMETGLKICNETYTAECNLAWFEREGPRSKVFVSAFEIDKFEVSNAEYGACVRSGSCKPVAWNRCSLFDESTGSWGVGITPHTHLQRPKHPAVCTSWEDADTFCRWAGKRLPTEAEWEKAARGDRDAREFPWGNQFDANLLNWGENTGFGSQDGFVTSSPVGYYQRGASPYGAYDMAGNAMEWTADWFDESSYRSANKRDPRGGTSASGSRIARGGSWTFAGNAGRVSYRFFLDPTTREDGVGFRCARGAKAGAAERGASGSTATLSEADIQRMIAQAGFKVVTANEEVNPGIRARVWIVSKGADNAAITRWSFDEPATSARQTIEHLKDESGFAGTQFGDIVLSVYVPEDSAAARRILAALVARR